MDELLSIVQKAIDEKKGERALLYDFHELNPFIDHVVICSAPSVRQTHAIAEGNSESRWVLVDLNSIVVHVFMNEERDHFQLEKLYADLPHEDFSL